MINQYMQPITQPPNFQQIVQPTPNIDQSYDMLLTLRIIFYLLVIIKLLEIVLHRKPKLSIRERIYRKFIFSHGEVIKLMNQQQKQDAEKTLKNTLQNANLPPINLQKRKSKQNKKIVFLTEENKYYEPKNYQALQKSNQKKQNTQNNQQSIQSKVQQSKQLTNQNIDNSQKIDKVCEEQQQSKNIKDPEDKIQEEVQGSYVQQIIHEIDRSETSGKPQSLIQAMEKVKHHHLQDKDPQQKGLLQDDGQQQQTKANIKGSKNQEK